MRVSKIEKLSKPPGWRTSRDHIPLSTRFSKEGRSYCDLVTSAFPATSPLNYVRTSVLLKRRGASRSVIRRVDADATGRLAPFRYLFNGLLGHYCRSGTDRPTANAATTRIDILG